jgi:hypothetical protein
LVALHSHGSTETSADDISYADIQVVKDPFADRYQPAASVTEACKAFVPPGSCCFRFRRAMRPASISECRHFERQKARVSAIGRTFPINISWHSDEQRHHFFWLAQSALICANLRRNEAARRKFAALQAVILNERRFYRE